MGVYYFKLLLHTWRRHGTAVRRPPARVAASASAQTIVHSPTTVPPATLVSPRRPHGYTHVRRDPAVCFSEGGKDTIIMLL